MGQNSIHLHNVCFFYTSKQYIRVNDVIASSQRVFHLRALQSQMSGRCPAERKDRLTSVHTSVTTGGV